MGSLRSPAPSRKLEGQVAVITGGASGLGEAIVRLFVESGALVIIADIQDKKGAQLANEVGLHVAAYKHCNVTLESDVEALVAFAIAKWGTLDIMVNNAGVMDKAIVEDVRGMDMTDFDHVISVNIRGMALGVKHASRAMVDNGIKGVILCMASIASVLAGMAPVVYTVSKHAVVGLVRAASSDLGKYGIRVNAISPYAVVTPLLLNHLCEDVSADLTSYKAEQVQALCDSVSNLTGHSLSSLDIARSALFLASHDAAFVSGLNLIVDGGFSTTKHSFNNK